MMEEGMMEAPQPKSRPPIEVGAPVLEVGAYTDIVSVVAPTEAGTGDEVEVSVKVKNLAAYPIYIAVTGKYDNNIYSLYPEYINVAAGGTYTFKGSFPMPNKAVRVYAWSWYWTGTVWYQDDVKYVDIRLAVPTFSNLSASYRRA